MNIKTNAQGKRRRADRERTHGHADHGGVCLRPYPVGIHRWTVAT